MPSDSLPILIFPRPSVVDRQKKTSGPGKIYFPSPESQRDRLTPKFDALKAAFTRRSAQLQQTATGFVAEQVLVLETVGSVEKFVTAVKHIPGMEWLGEWDEEDIPADENFYRNKDHDDSLSGKLFLIMVNQQAITELLSLWHRWVQNPGMHWERGRTKWRDLFQQLRDVRPWGVKDRLEETGVLKDWEKRISAKEERVQCEVEIWFRKNEIERERAKLEFEKLLSAEQGSILSQSVIPEIAYHAILAELPITSVSKIVAHQDVDFIKCDQVMFFRATGQTITESNECEPLSCVRVEGVKQVEGEPIVALLDGLPLENHQLLAGRLRVDDPDNWSADYPAAYRIHGTGMASLIIHGELDTQEQPLRRPLYVRPILKADLRDWRGAHAEAIPESELAVDLTYRAVRRLFEGEGSNGGAAPSVRIVNLSVGDAYRPFGMSLSPWARLLDWLSWQYRVLFVVSAGNQPGNLDLEGIGLDELERMSQEDLQGAALSAIASAARFRRLLAPAEGVNLLTVGASHEDLSGDYVSDKRRDVFGPLVLPSPINSIGLGYRRSVKPEILMSGGRQLYQEEVIGHSNHAVLAVSSSSRPPGQRVASPGSTSGELSATQYCRGTSNAAALTSRAAVLVHQMLEGLREIPDQDLFSDEYLPVILKTLLVHGSSWGDASKVLENIFRSEVSQTKLREYLARFLGYGRASVERVLSCTNERATLLGFSSLGDGQAHAYRLPLPPSLAREVYWRRLIITLSWLTPINTEHRNYRRASLWFEPPTDLLQVARRDVDWQTSRRGTVQHEILEGKVATLFTDGETVEIKVNCSADAGTLDEKVPYALAVTLEVAEGLQLPIYEEIRERIRVPIQINPAL